MRFIASYQGMSPAGLSLSRDPEREQHVPSRAAKAWIARVHKQHVADHHWTRAVERASFPRNTVHRAVAALGVEIPEQRALARREGANVSVHRAGEDRVWYRSQGARLRRTTAGPRRVAW